MILLKETRKGRSQSFSSSLVNSPSLSSPTDTNDGYISFDDGYAFLSVVRFSELLCIVYSFLFPLCPLSSCFVMTSVREMVAV